MCPSKFYLTAFISLFQLSLFAQAKLLEVSNYRWEESRLDWFEEEKTTYHYNLEGKVDTTSKYGWNNSISGWGLKEKLIYAYNQDGDIIMLQNEFFDIFGLENGNATRKISSYNLQGQLLEVLEQRRSSFSDSWIDQSLIQYKYDEASCLNEKVNIQFTQSTTFPITTITNYYRNNECQIDSFIITKNDGINPDLNPVEKEIYQYSDSDMGQQISTEFFEWNPFYEHWQKMNEKLEIYNSDNQLITYSISLNEHREEEYGNLEYNAEGQLTIKNAWSKAYESSDFRQSYEEQNVFHENGNLISRYLMENRFGLEYRTRYENTIDEKGFIIESKYSREVESDLGIVKGEHTIQYENFCDGLVKEEILDQPETPIQHKTRTKTTYLYDYGVDCQERPEAFEVSVYPNPSNGWINLQSDFLHHGPILVELYDLAGRLIWEGNVIYRLDNFSLNLSFLAEGMYTIKVSNENNTYSEKLLIQRNN